MQKERNTKTITQAHTRALETLRQRNRHRALNPRTGLDFASNDYLALAGDPRLAKAATDAIQSGIPTGAAGSRLLRGNHPQIEALESEAATHFQSQGALFFPTGFIANYALFSTLPMRGDLVVYDELIHASVHDGMRAGKAQTVKALHNDPQSFEDAITKWRADGGTGRIWISVESLYSMDGDRAPLSDLQNIATANDAFFVIDEAHATGVFGPGGSGLASTITGNRTSPDNLITMHTCGKALGVMGALLCAPQPLLDFMINRSRAFIYATAPSPMIAATVRAAIKVVANDDERRQHLKSLIELAGRKLTDHCAITPSGSQIQPVIVGSDTRGLKLATAMQGHGFDIRAIRPPTVPVGTSRLRLSFTLNVSNDDAINMIETLGREFEKVPQ